jgi:hypothetical protein
MKVWLTFGYWLTKYAIFKVKVGGCQQQRRIVVELNTDRYSKLRSLAIKTLQKSTHPTYLTRSGWMMRDSCPRAPRAATRIHGTRNTIKPAYRERYQLRTAPVL